MRKRRVTEGMEKERAVEKKNDTDQKNQIKET